MFENIPKEEDGDNDGGDGHSSPQANQSLTLLQIQ